MRFVEGGYLLYLQRHTYVCTQTQKKREKKGKRKKKGAIIRRGHPWSVQQGHQRKEKSASEEDTYEPSRLVIHDGVMLPPTIPLPGHHLLLHPSQRLLLRWTANFRHARTGFTIPDRRGSQAPSPWAPQHQRPPHRLSRLRHPLGRRKSSRRWCRRRRPESKRKKIAVSRLVSQQGGMGTMSVPGCYHRHPHQAWQACRREDLRAGACEGRRSGHRQCRRRQACRSNRPKDR